MESLRDFIYNQLNEAQVVPVCCGPGEVKLSQASYLQIYDTRKEQVQDFADCFKSLPAYDKKGSYPMDIRAGMGGCAKGKTSAAGVKKIIGGLLDSLKVDALTVSDAVFACKHPVSHPMGKKEQALPTLVSLAAQITKMLRTGYSCRISAHSMNRKGYNVEAVMLEITIYMGKDVNTVTDGNDPIWKTKEIDIVSTMQIGFQL